MSTVPAAFYGAWYKLEEQLLKLADEHDLTEDRPYIMPGILTALKENTKEILEVLGFDTKDVVARMDEFEKKKNENLLNAPKK